MSDQPIPSGVMNVGMNVAWINEWANAWVFSNFLYHASLGRASGTGTWTQDQGLITTTDQEDVFRFAFAGVDTSSGASMPVGTYTVLNPDGLPVYVGGYTPPANPPWNTATEFTFEATQTPVAQCLFVKGNVTNINGNLAFIAPDHLDQWIAGNIWYNDFITFHQGLNCNPLRFMDWTVASSNIEADWADRSVTTKPTLKTAGSNGNCVPYEFMCDIASRLNTDIWVCVPPRATQDYVNQMAALFAANMPSGRNVWLELGNELWNTADPWGDGTAWVNYLDYTKYTATADVANQKFVLANHGLTNGAEVASFATIENRQAQASDEWRLRLGVISYVKVLDDNDFELYADSALTSQVTVPQGQVNLLFVETAEAGKTADLNSHYGELCLRNWDAFDAAMGAGRINHIVSSWAGSPATTVGRLAVSGVQDRADYVAIAPYFSGAWVGGSLIASDGTITPGWWSGTSNTIHIGIYAYGSRPKINDVISGAGAISKQSYSYTAGASTYSSVAPVSGLTNGVIYDVHFAFSAAGVDFQLIGSISPSVTGETGYVYDTYSNQYLRNRLDTLASGMPWMENHKAVSNGVPIICYEGGGSYTESSPSQMSTWLTGYMESSEYAAATRHNLYCLASTDCRMHAHYADVMGTTFSISDSFSDISDLRYAMFAELQGRIFTRPQVEISNTTPDDVLTEPKYPYSVYNFVEYRIINGNEAGNFAMVGTELQMVNGAGVYWSSPSGQVLTVEADDGFTTNTATISFSLGDAWYPADADFAWDSTTDMDNTQITPIIGNPLPRTAGNAGAPISDGLWDMTGVVYSSAVAGGKITFSQPLLVAAVLDPSEQSLSWADVVTFGVGSFLAFYSGAAVATDFCVLAYTGAEADDRALFMPSGNLRKRPASTVLP